MISDFESLDGAPGRGRVRQPHPRCRSAAHRPGGTRPRASIKLEKPPRSELPLPAAAPASGDDDFLLRLYLRDALQEAMLTPEEEADLGRRAHAGDETARERLVLSHLRLGVRLAFDYNGLGLSLADLISEGNLGLIRAASLFNPAIGARFATYATVWIKQRIRRALTNQSRLVRLPSNIVDCVTRVKAAEARLGRELGRRPTDAELADDTDLVRHLIHQLRETGVQHYVALDSPAGLMEDGPTLADALADENAELPDESLARQSDREYVEELLRTLKPREQQVLRLRFGLDDGCERSLEEVGRSVGLVRQRVQQIEVASLGRLRTRARLERVAPVKPSRRRIRVEGTFDEPALPVKIN